MSGTPLCFSGTAPLVAGVPCAEGMGDATATATLIVCPIPLWVRAVDGVDGACVVVGSPLDAAVVGIAFERAVEACEDR